MRLAAAVLGGLLALCGAGAATAAPACSIKLEAPISISVPGQPFMALSSPDGCWLYVSLVTGENAGGVAVLQNRDGAFVPARTVKLKSAAFVLKKPLKTNSGYCAGCWMIAIAAR